MGYVVYPPVLTKDPNSGEISGFSAEILVAMADRLDVEVEWVEEVGWATMVEGLRTNRYDLVGTAVWPTAGRAKHAAFSRPLCYSVLLAYGRGDGEAIEVTSLEDLDSHAVRLATIDGEISEIVAKSRFPGAQRVGLPQDSQPSQALLNVVTGKADAAFVEAYVAEEYLKNNRGSIRVLTQEPVMYSRNSFMFAAGDPRLAGALDVALEELHNNGFVEGVLKKYDPDETFYRVAHPFREPH